MASIEAAAVWECTDCADGLDHCHGTLLVHLDGLPECSDHTCADADPARHALSAPCTEVAECVCGALLAEELAAAS